MVSRGVRYAVSCAGAQTSSLRLIRCKLAAVALGLSHGYRTVVMIDSDAFLRSGRLSLRIDDLVADHVATRHGEWSFASQRNGGPRTPLWMAGNAPFKPAQPNAGLQVCRRHRVRRRGRRSLRRTHTDRCRLPVRTGSGEARREECATVPLRDLGGSRLDLTQPANHRYGAAAPS